MREKLKESFKSIMPISIVILILGILFRFSIYLIAAFLICTVFLILGMGLFTYGADLSLMDLGKEFGKKIISSKHIITVLFIGLFLGIAITIAEPALQVLVALVPSIPGIVLILAISLGVGIFLSIAILRILYRIPLSKVILVFYGLLLILTFFSKGDFIPIAFDSGGVTTGPITVPFFIALGIGLSSRRGDKKSKEDTFGLIALCSIGPIIITLLLGFFFQTDSTYTIENQAIFSSMSDVFVTLKNNILPNLQDVLFSLLPIFVIFILFQFITKKFTVERIRRIVLGFLFTFVGLTIFLISINVGFLNVSYVLGAEIVGVFQYLLIPIGMVIGYISILAEPSVQILNEQVENVTSGSISKKTMNFALSLGVAIAIGLSLLRVVFEISILYILIPGYVIALILTFFSPKIFTAIAFDSGGAVSGPMTTSFLLPLAISACVALGGNVLTDAFGLVAFVAMTPLITIQLVGIIYRYQSEIKPLKNLDETIIDYEWEGNHE